MYCDNLENLVLQRHNHNKADELLILGGYIGYIPVEKISKEKIKTKVIYGCMRSANLNQQSHKKYKELTNNSNNLEVYYKKNYNHSKIYCWIKDKKVIEIIAGSANFSFGGLTNDYQETLFDINKIYYEQTHNYLLGALNDSEICTEYEFIPQPQKAKDLKPIKDKLDFVISNFPPSARLSLKASTGRFEERSGLNVGQAQKTGSHVNINDCYVPIRVSIIDELPELFPNRGLNLNAGTGWGNDSKKSKSNAEFLFDDGEVMPISFEGTVPRKTGELFKQFRSYGSNKLLGIYLRKRMGIKSGEAFTELDFKNYGRDTIDLTLLSKGQYYADFSVNHKTNN